MKRIKLLLFLIACLTISAFATHQRAGEITFRYISGLTYEITIISYSYAPSPADRCQLEINWGDGTTSVLTRSNGGFGVNFSGDTCHLGEIVGVDIKKNLYVGRHTFPGPYTYKISLEDPNRNYGIQNIPSSVDIPLYVETLLTINPLVGPDNSPQLLLPPIDQGCTGHPFIHNPGAYDPDGDSLSYILTVCRGAGGQAIPGYILPNLVDPNATGTFVMNPLTGDITWDSPTLQGEYNISFMIKEWRNGQVIGYVTRDMQITIVSCTNDPPVIAALTDTCITAGNKLEFTVSATDSNLDKINLSAKGQPFLLNPDPADFTITKDESGLTEGLFSWQTNCLQIKRSPYQVFFKAVDESSEVKLFDIKSMFITVVGPKTENFQAEALGNNIHLTWDPNGCSNAVTYKIYRRNGSNNFTPAYCETGISPDKGYALIDQISADNNEYTDGQGNPGLAHGVDYCYRIVAVYPDGSESYTSDEACVSLKKDVPIITNVSIDATSASNGQVYLAWSKPTEIDIQQAPGPYKYLIYRSNDLTGASLTLINTLFSLDDTIYTDTPVNTVNSGVSYKVEVWNTTPGLEFMIGPSQIASSVFLSFAPGDEKLKINFNYNVPWTDSIFIVYRKNDITGIFDSIGYSTQRSFTDIGLINGNTYCYKVKSIGSYNTPGITEPLINFSQEACAVPFDNEAPCPPEIAVNPDCLSSTNIVSWSYPNDSCSADVQHYYIYFRPPLAESFSLLDSVSGHDQSTYSHYLPISIAGCYSMKAADSIWNFSIMSDTICIDSDTCGNYKLPNFFTPNSDTYNDYFVPFPFTSVEKIDLEIYNRWGTLVFKTEDPQVKWDGKILGTNQPAADGVYYYVCDVFELSLNGRIKKTLKGSVTIVR